MKIIGMIGGIGPESTIDYYKRLLDGTQKRNPGGPAPAIIINSIDVQKGLHLLGTNQLKELTEYIVPEVMRLHSAGAEFGFLAANSPHIVFDAVQARSRLPLVSIVEATAGEATRLGCKRLGLFGTRFTMHGHFYAQVFERCGLALVVPAETEQTYIHDKYMTELVQGTLLPETREGLLAIVAQMKSRDGIDAVILGGTELPLVLRDATASGIPLIDTTVVHAKAIVAQALR